VSENSIASKRAIIHYLCSHCIHYSTLVYSDNTETLDAKLLWTTSPEQVLHSNDGQQQHSCRDIRAMTVFIKVTGFAVYTPSPVVSLTGATKKLLFSHIVHTLQTFLRIVHKMKLNHKL